MTTQHTPEPWRVDFSGVTDSVRNNCGMPIAYLNSYLDGAQANGRRIVACVNACAGLSNAELGEFNDGPLKHRMDDAEETLKAVYAAVEDVDYSGRCEQGIYALKKQRDELQNRVDFLNDQNTAQQEENDRVKPQGVQS